MPNLPDPRLAQALRAYRPETGVMSQPSQPGWKPEYEQEPPLEAPMISPEDIVQGVPKLGALGVKALAAALKGSSMGVPLIAGATFPWLSKEKLAKMIAGTRESGLTMMKPSDFVKATVPDEEDLIRLVEETGRFDPYKFARNPLPHLGVSPKATAITDHEGRHRMMGLMSSTGEDNLVPVQIKRNPSRGYAEGIESASGKVAKGQKWPDIGKKGADVKFGDVQPVIKGNENLGDMLADVNVPLKDVGISLYPANVSHKELAKALRAYNQPIPFGKIPPPIPEEL